MQFSLSVLKLLNEMLLSVGVWHLGSPSESVLNPGIDLSKVNVTDSLSSFNSSSSETGHGILSCTIGSSHLAFNLSNEVSLSLKDSLCSVKNESKTSGTLSSHSFLSSSDSLSSLNSCISDDLSDTVSGGVKGNLKVIRVLVCDLGVSVWVTKSEVVEFINSSEGVAITVVRAGTNSEASLLNIIATSKSEDVEGVDDLLSEAFNLRSNEGFKVGSSILSES